MDRMNPTKEILQLNDLLMGEYNGRGPNRKNQTKAIEENRWSWHTHTHTSSVQTTGAVVAIVQHTADAWE